jgi:hypothetical protein
MSVSCEIDQLWGVLGNSKLSGYLVNTIKNSSNNIVYGIHICNIVYMQIYQKLVQFVKFNTGLCRNRWLFRVLRSIHTCQ